MSCKGCTKDISVVTRSVRIINSFAQIWTKRTRNDTAEEKRIKIGMQS